MARPRIKHISAQELNRRTMAELKQQYIKQSYEARRRYKELEKKFPGSEVVLRRKGDFLPLSKMKGISKKDLAKELSDVTRFLSSRSSRVAEYKQVREETIQLFKKHEYGYITESNLDALEQFLEDARIRFYAVIPPSQVLVEMFRRAEKRELTREQILGNIEYWAEHGISEKSRLFASRYSSVEDFYENVERERNKKYYKYK